MFLFSFLFVLYCKIGKRFNLRVRIFCHTFITYFDYLLIIYSFRENLKVKKVHLIRRLCFMSESYIKTNKPINMARFTLLPNKNKSGSLHGKNWKGFRVR